MADTVVMDLPDGRELAWVEAGHKRGPAVLALHGTPGSRLEMVFDHKAIDASGARVIAPDRPGYGHSTYHKGRTLRGFADDMARLADHLKLERFAVLGVSGGGPHALACAYFLKDRLTMAGVVGGVGPMGGTDAMPMDGPNRLTSRLAARSQYAVFPMMALLTLVSRHRPDTAMRAAARTFAPADAALLERPEVRAVFADGGRRASPTTAMAAAQDFALFTRDWGFRLEDIDLPVHLWHGDDDRNVPVAHGRLQAARIPGSQLHEHPGEGHLLTIDHIEPILRTLTAP